MTQSEKWRTVTRWTATLAPFGALIGLVPGYFLGDETAGAMVAGALVGLLIAGGMVAFDTSWGVGLISRRWREAPFLVVLVTRSLSYLMIIIIGIGLPLLTVAGVSLSELVDTGFLVSVAISFVLALVMNFIGQVNRLLGRGVLVGLIVGRYHRPREEIRIFLLIDLRGSTQAAEHLGNMRYHAFLKQFITDVTIAAMRHGAEVHRYVGDEIIFTWTEHKGLANAACIRTVLEMADALEEAETRYQTEFGLSPSFWAGLHLGPVVTGEIGSFKHEIVYLGDTLNTAARIEQECRRLQRTFLASSEVVGRLQLPARTIAEPMGPIDLRGVAGTTELFAIARTD